jgi:hypothetical protein
VALLNISRPIHWLREFRWTTAMARTTEMAHPHISGLDISRMRHKSFHIFKHYGQLAARLISPLS